MLPRTGLLSLLFLAGCSAIPEKGLDCPNPESGSLDGTIRETAAQIKQAGQFLRSGGEAAIAELGTTLATRHPGVSRFAKVNYMVTAYCTIVDAGDGNVNAKHKRLSTFSARAAAILRRLPGS